METPYSVLGLPHGASPDEVRQAFKRLAFQHHPDRNPGDVAAAQRFKRIMAAFEAIEGKRAFAAAAARGSRKSYRVVWPDPWHPEPPTVQPSEGDELHYPTPEEIAALEVPSSFRPVRWLGGLLLLLVSFTVAMAYAHHATGVPIGPPDPNVQRVLEVNGRPY